MIDIKNLAPRKSIVTRYATKKVNNAYYYKAVLNAVNDEEINEEIRQKQLQKDFEEFYNQAFKIIL